MNYIIEYRCLDAAGKVLKQGKIKAKNKGSEFEALAGTENYLKSKVPGMVKMEQLLIVEASLYEMINGVFKNHGL